MTELTQLHSSPRLRHLNFSHPFQVITGIQAGPLVKPLPSLSITGRKPVFGFRGTIAARIVHDLDQARLEP